MRAFEIHVNGKKLWTAGIGDDGVLTAIMRSVLSAGKGHSPRAKEDLGLDVGGLISSTMEFVRWKTPRLRTGDEVRIRIVETERPDKPGKRERSDPALARDAERKYVERAAKRLGWTIVKTRPRH